MSRQKAFAYVLVYEHNQKQILNYSCMKYNYNFHIKLLCFDLTPLFRFFFVRFISECET